MELKNQLIARRGSAYIIFVLLIFSFMWSHASMAQVSLLRLQNNDLPFRQLLKKAKEDRVPILAVLYSPTYPVATPNEFENAPDIVSRYNVRPTVIDWASAPNQYPQRVYREIQNPSWMLIHPDEIIISVRNNISNDTELITFLESATTLSEKIEIELELAHKSKSSDKLLSLAKLCAQTYDTEQTSKFVEDYIKRVNPKRINDPMYQDLLRIGINGPFSKRLNKLINQDPDRAMMLTSVDTVLDIQRSYILYDLNKKGLMEPFFVWQRYEKELGYDADSLYRIFAINFFSTPPIEAEQLYNEAFDYLNFYPRSPWNYLDKLYQLVIPATRKQEDLEVLMDLISFQLFREKTYRKLDYKAVILYKLGQKERALGMIEEINRMALDQGHLYRSMLYMLTEN